MTLRRILPLVNENSPIGSWGMKSPTCPMHKHQDAIGAKHEECAKGVQTNMQGAIPLGQCKHASKLDYENMHVECGFGGDEDEKTAAPQGNKAITVPSGAGLITPSSGSLPNTPGPAGAAPNWEKP